MVVGTEAKQGVTMSKNQRQSPRKPATKLPNLQKKMQKAENAKAKVARQKKK
jgi:hypothetical protein